MKPLPSRSKTRNASRIISESFSLFIRFIIWQNSTNSTVPLPSISTSLIMSKSSCSVGFWPNERIAIPNSLVVIVPFPSCKQYSMLETAIRLILNLSRSRSNISETGCKFQDDTPDSTQHNNLRDFSPVRLQKNGMSYLDTLCCIGKPLQSTTVFYIFVGLIPRACHTSIEEKIESLRNCVLRFSVKM
uniref:Uncharacterized protein n=1 Tax=Romanomermis culicivorax TaxID=13658 RepID=A0A915JFN5_ROMCU